MGTSHAFTTPVGRMIGGSLYDPETTDYEGKPLVIKTGPNAGQSTVRYNIGIAIPKTPGVAQWGQEPWGAPIWQLAHAAFTAGETQRPDFAWKITDGDSTIPGKPRNGQPGKRPCDKEGYPGNWIIWMSSTQAPRIARLNNGVPEYVMEKGFIKAGYYVQIRARVDDNKPSPTAGLYWNPDIVCFMAYGPEITAGPNLAEAGFTAIALPPGASATPVGMGTLPSPASTPAPAVAAPAPILVHPSHAFVQVAPPPPAAPVAPPAGALPPGRVWALASHTYEQMKAAGWTDDTLVQHGHMR